MKPHRLVIGLTGINMVLTAALLVPGHRVSAAADSVTVRARAFELVDESGRVRAQRNVEANGLLLLDGSTEPGIHMLAKRSGTSVTLTNRGGQRRVITPE